MTSTTKKLSGLSIALPCHNERENLARVVEACYRAGARVADQAEVIVVCDGSTDGTHEEAERLRHVYPSLRVIRHPKNLGYGAAVHRGLSEARLPFVFFTDSDGQFDPAEIPLLVDALGSRAAALGYRLNRNDPPVRRFMGWLYTRIVCGAFGIRVRDMNCAFKLFRTSALARVEIRSRGALINAELLARLQQYGHDDFVEVGVHHYPRRHGRQSGARADVVLRAAGEFLRTWWELRFAPPQPAAYAVGRKDAYRP